MAKNGDNPDAQSPLSAAALAAQIQHFADEAQKAFAQYQQFLGALTAVQQLHNEALKWEAGRGEGDKRTSDSTS